MSQSEAAGFLAYATGDNVSGIEPAAHLAEAFAPVSGEPVVLIDEPDDKERIQPSDTGPSDFFLRGSKYGRVPDHQWHYRDRANRVVLTVCRFETPQGKAILQCTPWAQADGNVAWKWCGLPAERPLYDLPALLDNPDATVLVVEGERCVEAARQLVPKNWLVTTWSGGANAVSKTQWAALQNCEVHIWADADEPGRKAAKAIEALLPNATTYGDHAFAAIRKTKGSLPAGWDAGDAVDEGLTAGDFAALFHSKPDCLRILGIAELIKAHPKMRPPLIDGLLRQGEAMGLIAQPKLGKSYLVHALALCVATGRPWIGFSVRRGKVLICDFELHPETLADRLGSIAAHMDVEPESIDHLVRTCCVRGEEMDLDVLSRKLRSEKFDLIIIDALYRALGDRDENSNGQMTAAWNLIDATAQATGAGVVVVHHTSKGVQTGRAVTDVGSGAGAQSRAADTHAVLRAHEEPGAVVLEAVTRSFPAPEPRCLRKVDGVLWAIASELDPRHYADSDRPDRGNKAESFLATQLTDTPVSASYLTTKAGKQGIKAKDVRAALEDMRQGGKAYTWMNGRSPVWSSSPKPTPPNKPTKQEEINAFAAKNPEATVSAIANATNTSETYVRKQLKGNLQAI